MARVSPPSAFVNKVILNHNQNRSFLTYFLWLLCATRAEWVGVKMVLPKKLKIFTTYLLFREGVYGPLPCAPTGFVHLPVLCAGQRGGLSLRVSRSFVTPRMHPKARLEGFVSLQQPHTICALLFSLCTIEPRGGLFPIQSYNLCLQVGLLNSFTLKELCICLGVSWPFWSLFISPPFFPLSLLFVWFCLCWVTQYYIV